MYDYDSVAIGQYSRVAGWSPISVRTLFFIKCEALKIEILINIMLLMLNNVSKKECLVVISIISSFFKHRIYVFLSV